MSFAYRRWYAELSRGELRDVLDVGLTGAPDYVKALHPKNSYAAWAKQRTSTHRAAEVEAVPLPLHARHKYLLHLDGTAASNRLLKLLLMGSVVLKQVGQASIWHLAALLPGLHLRGVLLPRPSTLRCQLRVGM